MEQLEPDYSDIDPRRNEASLVGSFAVSSRGENFLRIICEMRERERERSERDAYACPREEILDALFESVEKDGTWPTFYEKRIMPKGDPILPQPVCKHRCY
jgi:hypothetical protein